MPNKSLPVTVWNPAINSMIDSHAELAIKCTMADDRYSFVLVRDTNNIDEVASNTAHPFVLILANDQASAVLVCRSQRPEIALKSARLHGLRFNPQRRFFRGGNSRN